MGYNTKASHWEKKNCELSVYDNYMVSYCDGRINNSSVCIKYVHCHSMYIHSFHLKLDLHKLKLNK